MGWGVIMAKRATRGGEKKKVCLSPLETLDLRLSSGFIPRWVFLIPTSHSSQENKPWRLSSLRSALQSVYALTVGAAQLGPPSHSTTGPLIGGIV